MFRRQRILNPVQFYSVSLLLTAVIYILLIILPFYVYGLHQQPVELVRGGNFDPKGYPLYASALGWAAFVVLVCGSIWMAGGGLALASVLARKGRHLPTGQRLLGAAAVFASASTLVFMISPWGWLIVVWLMD